MSLSGNLEKWTNYWLGWQSRYFKLENGILSYYQNEEEVDSGAKASLKVSSCDIVPDIVDNRKFDVTVGSGQRFSLRASSTSLRQTWLIALGSAKQENDGRALLTKQNGDKSEKLNKKSTELRLYCDLLVQQVDTIQISVNKAREGTDSEDVNLNENAVMLSATCKTFIKTLKDTMALMNENVKSFNALNSGAPVSPKSRNTKIKRTPSTTSLPIGLGQNQDSSSTGKKSHKRTSSNVSQFSTGSLDFHTGGPPDTQSLRSFRGIINESDIESNHGDGGDKEEPFTNDHDSDKEIFSEANSSIQGEILVDKNFPEKNDPSISEQSPILSPKHKKPVSTDEVIDLNQSESNKTIIQRDTFFNVMQHSFEGVNLERNPQSGLMEIPTEPFLLASGDFLPILDKLGSKAFQPVKMDISGNISKIRIKYQTDEAKFSTLQSIVMFEKQNNTTNVSNSATDAIMWLKRGLTFVKEFLKNVGAGEKNLTKALQDAYMASLAKHHGWVVRGVFHLALKAAPYYSDFVDALTGTTGSADDAELIDQLLISIKSYTSSLENILIILDDFYKQNNLESSKVI